MQFGLFTFLQISPDEKLVNSFNSFVSTVNTIIAGVGVLVGVLTLAVTVAAIATPIILNNLDRKIRERTEDRVSLAISRSEEKVQRALTEIDQTVKRRVQQEIVTLRDRTQYLEELLNREIVIEKTLMNYYVPEPLNQLPEGYVMLKSRGFQVPPANTLDESEGDIVVLDLIHHPERETLTNEQIKKYLDDVISKMKANILIVYVRPENFPCIREKRTHPKHLVSANFLVSFLGTAINAAYVADGMKR